MNCNSVFFFFNDTATTEIYTLSLHDALPISSFDGNVPQGTPLNWRADISMLRTLGFCPEVDFGTGVAGYTRWSKADRKSTRLNSSHANISYAVFCLKKKNIVTHLS